jgi:hypothetical protein
MNNNPVPLTAASVAALLQHSALEELSLQSTAIDDTQLGMLARAICAGAALQSLE